MLDFLVTHSRIAHSFAASYAMRFGSAAGEVSTEAVSESESACAGGHSTGWMCGQRRAPCVSELKVIGDSGGDRQVLRID